MGCSLGRARFTAAEMGIITHDGQRASGAGPQTWRGTAGLAARGQPDTQAQRGPACAWEARSSCPMDSFLHGHFFLLSEDRVFSEAATPTWVESSGQKGALAHLLCFTYREIEAQSRKPRAQVGGWLLKSSKGILQNREEKAQRVRKSV